MTRQPDFSEQTPGSDEAAVDPSQKCLPQNGVTAITRDALSLLELDKILEQIAGVALSPISAEEIRALQPLSDANQIQRNLDEVTEMRAILDFDEIFPLNYLPDLRPAMQHLRIAGRTLEIPQLIELAQFLTNARRVRAYLLARREKYPLLAEIAQQLTPLQEAEAAIENAINFTDGSVKDSASPVLSRLRKEIRRAMLETRERLQGIVKKLAARDMLQEEVITLRDGRLVLMLKDEYRHRVPGLVHDESASGHTVFLEPMESVEMNNRIRQLQSAEREEIERILLELSNRLRLHLPRLQENLKRLVQLDVIHAKAHFSRQLDCSAPELQKPGILRLVGARHPLLLLTAGQRSDGHRKTREQVVPLTLELGGEAVTLILTGPNAGGKTVALKTVGLLSLMTLCGLHIPAQPDSQIPIFRHIFVDIGDRQSIEEDLSTFTSRLARLVEILRCTDAGDLVLIDEIGAGTDPEAGAALAMAILKELTQRRCTTIVTTHHGALKSFAHETAGVVNGSMAFDRETLRPTYQFRPGIPGASYAFEIAERLGLQKEVLTTASQLVGKEKGKIENLLAELEARLREQRQSAERVQLEETRLTALSKLYEERLNTLKTQERELKQKAVAEAEAILQRANAAVEKAIREIREQAASREAIQSAKKELQAVQNEIVQEKLRIPPAPVVAETPLQEARPGMRVKWIKQDAVATVLEAADSSQRVLVEVGKLRARVPLSELRRHDAPAQASLESLPKFSNNDTPATLPEIDLRGMRVDEALEAVDKFLDDALLAGWSEVRIIHGKGTGALRQSINNFLKDHPQTQRFHVAPMGEGDFGVTVVELK
ncbi:MAG: endonuclease MutS2 [candidate division KSB1 bacterium]|nr:endonuclease MutS2 [candidate division KSB1 bacterium]MDZ7302783.1 endonuclease MutS2 [candidate division KSB1 bacterium]MDZ7310052.1 endonuclease MutS2 [candidate division KSB1 bacterium]